MRVLISTAGSHSDVLPFVALGQEFATQGHEVFLYANPFFSHYVTDTPIRFVTISTVERYSTVLNHLVEDDSTKVFKRAAQEYAALCPEY